MITIKEMLAPAGSKCRPGRSRTGFVGVTLHNTGNSSKGSGAENHGRYLQGTGSTTAASWHYAVDKDMAVRSIPEREVAYHAGDGAGNGNYKTIAIEICMNSDGDLKKATDNAAELAADILRRYGIKTAKGYLYQHYNWSKKNCPQMLRAGKPYSWDTFVAKVQAHLDGIVEKEEEEEQEMKYTKIGDIPEWARPAIQQGINNGYIAVDSKGEFGVWESNLQVAVWMYSAGLWAGKAVR